MGRSNPAHECNRIDKIIVGFYSFQINLRFLVVHIHIQRSRNQSELIVIDEFL